jgi:hypothetical protein
MSTNLLNLDPAALEAFFASVGEKPFRARQVLRWMHQRGEADFGRMSDHSGAEPRHAVHLEPGRLHPRLRLLLDGQAGIQPEPDDR